MSTKSKPDNSQLRCGICNIAIPDGNWDKHTKTPEHQRYLNDPTILVRAMAQQQYNLMERMLDTSLGDKLGTRPPIETNTLIKEKIDFMNKDDPREIYDWFRAMRLAFEFELANKCVRIFLTYLRNKYGTEDFRFKYIFAYLNKDKNIHGYNISIETVQGLIHYEAVGREIHPGFIDMVKRDVEGGGK